MDIRGVLQTLQGFCEDVREKNLSGEEGHFSAARNKFASTLRSMGSCCEREEGTSVFQHLRGKCTEAKRWVFEELVPFLKKITLSGRRQVKMALCVDNAEQYFLDNLGGFKNLILKVKFSSGEVSHESQIDLGEFGQQAQEQISSFFRSQLGDQISKEAKTNWETRHVPLADFVLELTAYGDSREVEGVDSDEVSYHFISYRAVVSTSSGSVNTQETKDLRENLRKEELDDIILEVTPQAPEEE